MSTEKNDWTESQLDVVFWAFKEGFKTAILTLNDMEKMYSQDQMKKLFIEKVKENEQNQRTD